MAKVQEEYRQKSSRRIRKLPTAQPATSTLPEALGYPYKKKVVDEDNRKVWLFMKDTSGVDRTHKPQGENGSSPNSLKHRAESTSSFNKSSKNLYNKKTNTRWSMDTVTTKVLKMVKDIEFYNGVVFGYDEERAKQLLLQKGRIDEGDFPDPSMVLKHRDKNRIYEGKSFPAYGKWMAEASFRDISLEEALKILSDNQSTRNSVCCTRQRRWRSPFYNKRRRGKGHSGHRNTLPQEFSTVDSLLLAASGHSTSSKGVAASETTSPATSDVGIRLAEYSTVFDKTRMSCSVLLVRTFGGAEAEVRVVSGSVESPESWLPRWPKAPVIPDFLIPNGR
jgi:hypothetical protein